MDTTQRTGLMQRWQVVQGELIPGLGKEVEGLTPKLEKLIPPWNGYASKNSCPAWQGIGRPPKGSGRISQRVCDQGGTRAADHGGAD